MSTSRKPAGKSNKESSKKVARGGRPKISGKKKRTIKQELYLNQEERDKLDTLFKASNFKSINELIRAMLFESSVKLYYEDKNKEKLIYQLSKIGGNLNQISRNMNRIGNSYNSFSNADKDVFKQLTDVISNIKL